MRRPLLVAVWLLGVAGLWWALPPAPAGTVVGAATVSADGLAVVTGRTRPPPTHRNPLLSAYPVSPVPAPGPVRVVDVATGRRLWAAHGPTVGVGVEWTADGRRLLVSVGEVGDLQADAVEVREATTGGVVGRFHADTLFSPPDARLALVPRFGREVHDLVETATGGWRRRVAGGYPSFSPDGRRLLVAPPGDHGGSVYDCDTGRLIARFADPRTPLWDGDNLRDLDGVVWDAAGHTARRRVPTLDRPAVASPHGFALRSLWLTENDTVAVAEFERRVPAGAAYRWLARRDPAFGQLADDRYDRRTRLLDAATEAVLAEVPGDGRFVRRSADGRTLYTVADRADGRPVLAAWPLTPRPSPMWLTAGAVGWAAVLGWIARRRA